MAVVIGGGGARVEDAQGTPTQSHISPSMLVNEDETPHQIPEVGCAPHIHVNSGIEARGLGIEG